MRVVSDVSARRQRARSAIFKDTLGLPVELDSQYYFCILSNFITLLWIYCVSQQVRFGGAASSLVWPAHWWRTLGYIFINKGLEVDSNKIEALYN